MHLHMIIKLLARELALADFVLVLVRCDAVFADGITMAVFNGLGGVGGVGGFVAVPWLGGIRRRGGRGGGGGGGVVEGCCADGGSCGEPRGGLVRCTLFGGTWDRKACPAGIRMQVPAR